MTIDEKLDLIIQMLKAGAAPAAKGAPAKETPAADERDLDSEHGSPEVKKNPKGWDGDDFVGKRLHECSPEFLDAYAKHADNLAQWLDGKGQAGEMGNNGKPIDGYWKRKDAARARGWAKRLRAGWGQQSVAEEDLPF